MTVTEKRAALAAAALAALTTAGAAGCASQAVDGATPALPGSEPRIEAVEGALAAPASVELAPPIWETREGTSATLVSLVDERFGATLADALAARGFRLTEPKSRAGAADAGVGRVLTTLHASEGGGGVRAEVTLAAEVTVVSGDARRELHGLRVTSTGELVEGLEALGDVSTTLARLRAVTARESASQLAGEIAASLAAPATAPPALVRKRAPIENPWAVPVAGRLPLLPWDEIDAGMEAEPGLTGTVTVADAAGAILAVVPLLEARPGHYATRLAVPPGVKPGVLATSAALTDDTGRTETVTLGSGALLADTDRPLPPAGLVVRRAAGKGAGAYELTWSYRPESGVVHHYRVFRSDGFPYRFTSIGETRETRFVDPIVADEHGFFDLTRRYYTVVGYDAVGNPSPPSELVSISPEPDAKEGAVLFAPGRPRAEEAAARRDRPPVVARYRVTTRVERPGRVAVTAHEVGDPRAMLTFATGRVVREADGAIELVIVALGSESATTAVSTSGDPRWWPLAEVEPGTYAGTVPLSTAAGDASGESGDEDVDTLPARLAARVRLRDAAGFEVIATVDAPAGIASPATISPAAAPPSELEPDEGNAEPEP